MELPLPGCRDSRVYVTDDVSKSLSKPTTQDLLDSMELRANVDVPYTTVCVRLPLCTDNITSHTAASSAALDASSAGRDDPDVLEETFERPERYLREDQIEDEAPDGATKLINIPRCYSTFYYNILNGVHIHQRLATQHLARMFIFRTAIHLCVCVFFLLPGRKPNTARSDSICFFFFSFYYSHEI